MSKYVYTSCYLNIIIFCLANMKIQHINVFSALFTVKVFKYAAFTIDEFYNQKHVDFSFNKKYNGTFLLKNIHTSSLPFIFCFFFRRRCSLANVVRSTKHPYPLFRFFTHYICSIFCVCLLLGTAFRV